MKLFRVAVLLALLFVAGCGDGGSSTESVTPPSATPPSSTEAAATTRRSVTPPPSKKGVATRPYATPPLYHLTDYDVETTWAQDTSEKKVGRYLENAWHDPAAVDSLLVIDSQASDGAAPPLAAAELARIQTSRLPEYHERSLKKIKVSGHPAVRWAFDVAGEGYVEYFFAKCGTSIFLRGSTDPGSFENFSDYYRVVASRVKIVCDK